MRPFPLSWIFSILTLQSVSSADEPLSFKTLANELQHKILVSNSVDFCEYVRSVIERVITPASPEVENAMLVKAAEEEWGLELNDDTQRVRKQRLLKSVRTFVRIRSRLPIDCTEMDTKELGHWREVLESSFESCSSFSESPTWRKACMAGLFGRNTLGTFLPHLSAEFRLSTNKIMLQTAFFIGDIHSLEAIVTYFGMSNDEVLEYVLESDIVFSGSVDFFNALLERLPNMMEKRLKLIREASSLNRLDILMRIFKVTESVEFDNLDHILDSLWQLKLFNCNMRGLDSRFEKIEQILKVAAEHGHLPIIRFMWPAIGVLQGYAEYAVRDMMIKAGSNNHRSVLEFLLFESGNLYIEMARQYVNRAFEAAVGSGNIELLDFFRGYDNAGNPVAPGLGLTTLSTETLYWAINVLKNWKGLKYLVDLKNKGDHRFAEFELVDQDNTALCKACEVGIYNLVEYLLRRTDDGKFIFTFTNPAVQKNLPLFLACSYGHWPIVEKLLERDVSGKYIYEGIDPSAKKNRSIINACYNGHLEVVKVLLKMKDGRYILPGMESVNLTRALHAAIYHNRKKIVEFLCEVKDGKYVFPGMNGADLTKALKYAIHSHQREAVGVFLSRALDGSYLHPGVKVTEDMLTIGIQKPEMTELLERNLAQQCVDT